MTKSVSAAADRYGSQTSVLGIAFQYRFGAVRGRKASSHWPVAVFLRRRTQTTTQEAVMRPLPEASRARQARKARGVLESPGTAAGAGVQARGAHAEPREPAGRRSAKAAAPARARSHPTLAVTSKNRLTARRPPEMAAFFLFTIFKPRRPQGLWQRTKTHRSRIRQNHEPMFNTDMHPPQQVK